MNESASQMNTLSRSVRRTAAGLALLGLSAACGSAATPVREPQSNSAHSAGAASEAKRPSKQLSDEPLTLLADPPAPDAEPVEPVSTRGWLGVA